MNTTIEHATRTFLMGLTCGIVLVFSSNAIGEEDAGEARQPVRDRNDNANGQVENDQKDPIVKQFEGIVTAEHLLKLRLTELHQKFRPGHPKFRRTEAQLENLGKQRAELLKKHPLLLRQQENQRKAEERLRALRAQEHALQSHLDEVKEEQEFLLKKHPEL
ncbi:hypothetical protein [Haloferula sp.]|uniref:hypothetical protein n=1 Tax=Haloferula sp. TaxID=2497595 RepID=UPI00329E37BF